MLRRSKTDRAKEHAVSAAELAFHLAQDRKFRKRLTSALGHGSAATRHARRGFGPLGNVIRLAQDETLARELKNARADLERAYGRLETQRRGRKRRRLILLAALAPLYRSNALRQKLTAVAQKTPDAKPSAGHARPRSLEDLTKEELYQRAQEAEIAGRSDMTKDELVAALRAHS
jgi:hypothetical protein